MDFKPGQLVKISDYFRSIRRAYGFLGLNSLNGDVIVTDKAVDITPDQLGVFIETIVLHSDHHYGDYLYHIALFDGLRLIFDPNVLVYAEKP